MTTESTTDRAPERPTVEVTDAEFAALREAVCAKHAADVDGGRAPPQVLRAFCVCGFPTSPGPLACAALRKIVTGA